MRLIEKHIQINGGAILVIYKTTDLYEAAYFKWKGVEPVNQSLLGNIIEWEFEFDKIKDIQVEYHNNIRGYVSEIIKLKSLSSAQRRPNKAFNK